MKLKIFLSAIIIFSYTAFPQTDFSFGGFAGGGSFKGNSTSVGGFTTSLFAEANLPLFEEVFPRLSFIFIKDLNALLPNTNQPYNPYLLGVSFKGVTTQYFDNKIFLEEGVGFLALNDRTFSDTDVWDYGVVLSFSVGYDLRNFDLKGFKIGAGAEYGLTFFQTLPQYSSIHLLVHYTI
ncbi:MAG: hypothetical protein BroJett005_01650 [Ignavibacteriota bacterium]|nr:MAG: hypothetical protein BroJett005_01650 [Ignavibacteriota bacterium]